MKKESAMPSRTIGLTCRISLMLHIKMPLLYIEVHRQFIKHSVRRNQVVPWQALMSSLQSRERGRWQDQRQSQCMRRDISNYIIIGVHELHVA